MKFCAMCGRLSKTVTNATYQYDNGEQFTTPVCGSCYDLHESITKGVTNAESI